MSVRSEITVVKSSRDARRLGRYILCDLLSQGGMGKVYLGRVEGPGGFEKLVAVKVMHSHMLLQRPELRTMFLDEARIAARVSHQNVCSVFDFGEEKGVLYLVMEYLNGQSIEDINERLSLDPELRDDALFYTRAARIVAEACEGLHCAHTVKDEKGQPLHVIHRDVSPGNVFVTFNGSVRVMDFGIARATGRLHQTEAGVFKGKLAYASPEAFAGNDAVDARTDIWSMGALLWELLAGEPAFLRDTPAKTLGAIVREPIVAPSSVRPGIPQELDRIALRALAREREDRYDSARELSRALNRFAVASGEHIGTAELGEWLQGLFPKEHTVAVETESAARELDLSEGEAPELITQCGQHVEISEIVVRHGPEGPEGKGAGDKVEVDPSAGTMPGEFTRPATPVSIGMASTEIAKLANAPTEELPVEELATVEDAPVPEPPRRTAWRLWTAVAAAAALGAGVWAVQAYAPQHAFWLRWGGSPPGPEAVVVVDVPPDPQPEEQSVDPATDDPGEAQDVDPAAAVVAPAEAGTPAEPGSAGAEADPSVPEAAEPAAEAADSPTVEITVTTDGEPASIYEDGHWLGRTPDRILLTLGRHTLLLRTEDGRMIRKVVVVRDGQPRRVQVDVRPPEPAPTAPDTPPAPSPQSPGPHPPSAATP